MRNSVIVNIGPKKLYIVGPRSKKKPLKVTYDFFNVDTIVQHFYDQVKIL
jgi:hypothetical protein